VTTRTFVTAALQPWPESQPMPYASARRGLGRAGDIEGGTTALLAASAIRTEDFTPEVLACLPAVPWRVTEADLAERRDLRWACRRGARLQAPLQSPHVPSSCLRRAPTPHPHPNSQTPNLKLRQVVAHLCYRPHHCVRPRQCALPTPPHPTPPHPTPPHPTPPHPTPPHPTPPHPTPPHPTPPHPPPQTPARSWRIFSIDPITARDLDDALSIEPLPPSGPGEKPRWRVGVHIADVASFVKAGTELDKEAAARGTST
jgi:hypothetical protein